MSEKLEGDRAGWTYLGHVGLRDGFSVGPLRTYCSPRCAAEEGIKKTQPIDKKEREGLVDCSDDCFRCGASLWRKEAGA